MNAPMTAIILELKTSESSKSNRGLSREKTDTSCVRVRRQDGSWWNAEVSTGVILFEFLSDLQLVFCKSENNWLNLSAKFYMF